MARAWAAVVKSTSNGKYAVNLSEHCGYFTFIEETKVQQEPAAVNFHFRTGREVPSNDRAYPQAEFFLMHCFDSDKFCCCCFWVWVVFFSFFWLEVQTVILASAEFEGNEKVQSFRLND